MHTNTFSSFASLEEFSRVHDLAKLHALQLRRAAVGQFWGSVFARVSGLLAHWRRDAGAAPGGGACIGHRSVMPTGAAGGMML